MSFFIYYLNFKTKQGKMQPKKNPSMSSTPADKIFTTELRICSVYVKINK